MKYCVDCIHHKKNGTHIDGQNWLCLYNTGINIVTGERNINFAKYCKNEREDVNKCGPDAKNFEDAELAGIEVKDNLGYLR